MVRLYTFTGDDGTTGLLYGGRVSKADLHTEAYGTTDETISALGLARALATEDRVKEVLARVQRDLFTVGAELATDPQKRDTFLKRFAPVTAEMTQWVQDTIDALMAEVRLPRSFIIPGASQASAALDVARTVCRRAERRAVALDQAGGLANREVLRYLNRLSDLLFALARYTDRHLPLETLTPGATPEQG